MVLSHLLRWRTLGQEHAEFVHFWCVYLIQIGDVK